MCRLRLVPMASDSSVQILFCGKTRACGLNFSKVFLKQEGFMTEGALSEWTRCFNPVVPELTCVDWRHLQVSEVGFSEYYGIVNFSAIGLSWHLTPLRGGLPNLPLLEKWTLTSLNNSNSGAKREEGDGEKEEGEFCPLYLLTYKSPVDLHILNISCKWNHAVYGLL